MQVTVDKTVSYDVKTIEVVNVTMRRQQDALVVLAHYRWKDSGGKVIRQSMAQINQADLAAMATVAGQDGAALVAALAALLPTTGKHPVVRVTWDRAGEMVVQQGSVLAESNPPGYSTVVVTDGALAAVGLSKAVITALVESFASQMT
jgi:hypothetical protein